MSEYFVGQIIMSGFGFAPKNFALCSGQLIGIQQNQVLFSLLGTVYGGNGTTNFALPNLQGRTPVGYGPSQSVRDAYPIGMSAGSETVTVLPSQMPQHTHAFGGSKTNGGVSIPVANQDVYATATANSAPVSIYADATAGPLVGVNATGSVGGTTPHENMQPFGVVNFSIALSGLYPSRN